MTFRIRVWCKDCGGGQDPMGCFGGESELSDEVYETREEAAAAGEKECREPPWDFKVEEEPAP